MVGGILSFLFWVASWLIRLIIGFLMLLVFQTIWVDCFACGVVVTLLCCLAGGINWFVAVLIGAGAVVGLAFLKNTKAGYWIIAVPMSLVWGALFGLIACMIASGSGPDTEMTAMFTTFGIASAVVIGLHVMNWVRYTGEPELEN